MTGGGGQGVGVYFIDDIVTVVGEIQDVTVEVSDQDRVEKKVRKLRHQGSRWFIV